MAEQRTEDYQSHPKAETCRLLDFEQAEIVTLESFPPQYVLVVRGTKPFLNIEVDLVPRVYVRQPEYWGIEVVGYLPAGVGLPAIDPTAPYTVSIRLAGFTGTKGVEVIGATHSEKLEVPPKEETGDVVTEPSGFPEANLFELRGKDVEITYGVLRARREFLDYKDEQRDLTFSGEKGEIDSLESRIGRMHTVTLEVVPDSHELTLTLLLPQINLEGQGNSFETLAIRTSHLTSIGGPGLVKGPLQTYEVVPLRGTASQVD